MTPVEVLKEIARGRTDNGRPLAAETARQKARRWLTLCGIDWGAKNAPSAPGKTGMDKTLAEIARQTWMECPLDEDHWEATAQAVRDAVIEECAKVVAKGVNWAPNGAFSDEWFAGSHKTAEVLAKALRSLKSKEVSNDAD